LDRSHAEWQVEKKERKGQTLVSARLTAAEEKIIHAVMDILALVLENDWSNIKCGRSSPCLIARWL
jgi:hypothetical protein